MNRINSIMWAIKGFMGKCSHSLIRWMVVLLVMLVLQTIDRIYWKVGNCAILHIVSWAALLSIPALFRSKWARHLCFGLLTGITFWELLEQYLRRTMSTNCDGTLVFIISATNKQETLTFLQMIGWWQLLLIAVIALSIPFGFWLLSYRMDRAGTNKKRRFSLIASGVILLFWGVCNGRELFPQPTKQIFTQCHWLASCKSIGKTVIEFRKIIGSLYNSIYPDGICMKDANSEQKSDLHPPIGIIVIGESSCRNYWHLYGYSRNTTPLLDTIKDELLVFSDVCGVATETSTGLLNLFTKEEKLSNGKTINVTLGNFMVHAGVTCAIVSAQPAYGKYGNFQNAMFASVPVKKYLYTQDKGELLDLSLIPILRQLLATEHHDKPNLYFVHIMGNHFPCNNYRKENAPFEGCEDEEVRGLDDEAKAARNRYDNTVIHTDETFYAVIQSAKENLKARPAFVLFVSDHGDTPRHPWRHAPSRDLWELPMVLWMNEAYQQAYPEFVSVVKQAKDKPMTSDRLFWGMVSLMRFTFPGYPVTEDIFSAEYVPPTRRRVYRGKYLYQKGTQELLAE